MRLISLAAFALLTGCSGQSQEKDLQDAAAQSDPAAAAVLNNAAEAGVDPQQALEAAGQAAAANAAAAAAPRAGPPSGTVQARPNLPGSPNRKDGTQPPDRMVVGENKTGVAGGTETGIRPETEAGPDPD